MSCRVLGRGVEAATLALLVAEARRRGAARLVGEYAPSVKNAMVRDHYEKLGFAPLAAEGERKRLALLLVDYNASAFPIALEPPLP